MPTRATHVLVRHARARALALALSSGALAAAALAACGSTDEVVVDRGDVRVVDVATSNAQEGWAVNYPKQRKVLFMAGRLWVFYADGTSMLARSTTNGVTLSDPIVVRDDAVFGHRCAFAFDGTALHSACCSALPGSDVFYRRGVPSADGTIAWDGDEQVAFDVPDTQSVLYPKVIVAGGRPWVAFMLFEGGFETAPQRAMVTRSARTDGTWETDTAGGFPFALSAASTQTFPDPLGVALASGDTYWIWDPDGDAAYTGRAFHERSGWGAEEQISLRAHRHGLFDAVANGDDLHVSYGGGLVYYRRRAADGTWSPERTVTPHGSGHTSISTLGPSRALVTWLDYDGNRVVQREMSADGTTTGPATLVLGAGDDGLAGTLGINLNGLAAPGGPFASAVTATLGAGPPYRVVLATR